ncbi:MAG TPA: RNA polymerase sigma factor SigM [Nocardioidaceae bacterium]|jgi:RNA polymerase sigma-70 factor (ECF subfamily)|nr:RNA polymerase sigma factor SigM [Propionibacteriales bacterium]MDQ3422408.1 RNA polymerase sigma factor SigM [Actinomycetota bacterium]HEV8055394.1 RNA polymerase sigma factor SigM [Nocardioidaceae bacterium]
MSGSLRHLRGGTEDVADDELLRLHTAGDPDAFGELFARHQNRLWAVALGTLGDPEQAADALQDAMISAFRRAGSYRGDAQVTTWLHRIVVNACLDSVRRRRVRATEPLPVEEDRAPELGSAEHDPGERVGERDEVTAALSTLAWEQRAALVLVDMLGYSVEDAAQALDCAPGTVKSRCARGRARLAPLLAHLRNPPDDSRVEPVSAVDPSPGGDLA